MALSIGDEGLSGENSRGREPLSGIAAFSINELIGDGGGSEGPERDDGGVGEREGRTNRIKDGWSTRNRRIDNHGPYG